MSTNIGWGGLSRQLNRKLHSTCLLRLGMPSTPVLPLQAWQTCPAADGSGHARGSPRAMHCEIPRGGQSALAASPAASPCNPKQWAGPLHADARLPTNAWEMWIGGGGHHAYCHYRLAVITDIQQAGLPACQMAVHMAIQDRGSCWHGHGKHIIARMSGTLAKRARLPHAAQAQ